MGGDAGQRSGSAAKPQVYPGSGRKDQTELRFMRGEQDRDPTGGLVPDDGPRVLPGRSIEGRPSLRPAAGRKDDAPDLSLWIHLAPKTGALNSGEYGAA